MARSSYIYLVRNTEPMEYDAAPEDVFIGAFTVKWEAKRFCEIHSLPMRAFRLQDGTIEHKPGQWVEL